MANNNNEGVNNNPDSPKDSGLDQSLVGKFVSGIFNNTPLSKWFGKDSASQTLVRRRDDEDDVSYILQPPNKRAKRPTPEHNNYSVNLFESLVTVTTETTSNHRGDNGASKVLTNFPEPVPGPSGIRSRRLLDNHSKNAVSNNVKSALNGDTDSDSEESSGYASAAKIGKFRSGEATQIFNSTEFDKATPKARSLFTSTTSEPNSSKSLFDKDPHPDKLSNKHMLNSTKSPQAENTSLSSRRPNFNASAFGSPHFVDRTLSTKRILSSPFYSGNTIYGGASAYNRRFGRTADTLNQIATRNSVQIKPVNEKSSSENATLSKTARRILNALEQFSTPISDAKKIPVETRQHGALSQYVGASPYMVRDRKRASAKELQVPTIPDLLQMKQKERLQNSTESVRQIATSSKSKLNKEYKLRSDDGHKHKHSNKMKTSVAPARQKNQAVEIISDIALPKVALPITTLPKFDLGMIPPPPVSTPHPAPKKRAAPKKEPPPTSFKAQKRESPAKIPTVDTRTKDDFTFAPPLVISKQVISVKAANCFKFSEPINKKAKNNGLTKLPPLSAVFKPPSDKWECPTCLVFNDSDKNDCVACNEPRPGVQDSSADKPKASSGDIFKTSSGINTPKTSFGDQFKMAGDKWECAACMVRNDNSASKCVACTSAKPGSDKQAKSGFGDKFKPPSSSWECSSCMLRNVKDVDMCVSCTTPRSSPKSTGFGDKFKPSIDSWECTICLIRNKAEWVKCASCESAKPGVKTLGFNFKTSSNTWECPTCMIRNKNEAAKCVACETAQPNGVTVGLPVKASSTPSFSFGMKQPHEWECKTCMIKNKNEDKKCIACEAPKDDGFGGAFKISGGDWECQSCMVRNKTSVDACVCCGGCRPGSEKKPAVKEEKKPIISFNFGIDKSAAGQFQFGIPAEKKEEAVKTDVPPSLVFGSKAAVVATPTTVTFGIKSSSTEIITPSISSNPLLKASEKLPEKAVPAPVGFKFGVESQKVETKPDAPLALATTTSIAASPKPMFQFKPASVNGEAETSVAKPPPAFSFSAKLPETKEAFKYEAPKAAPAPAFKFEAAKPNEAFKFGGGKSEAVAVPVPQTQPAAASASNMFKFGGAAAPAPKRSFGDVAEAGVNGFGSAAKVANFGGGGGGGFGGAAAKAFSFGSVAEAAAPKPGGFSFGQAEKPAGDSLFKFGGGAPAGAGAAAANSSAGFNFSVTSVQSSGFNFGSNGQKETSVVAFGAAAAPVPAAKNGSFNFGSNPNNNNQKAVFSFGASQPNPQAQAGFGQQGQAPGFNFGPSAPAPTAAAPSPGSFNFTGPPPSFGFTPGAAPQNQSQRRIKRAMRRTTNR